MAMDQEDGDFLRRLLETFRVEADEHIDVLADGLVELERSPDGPQHLTLVETLFREAHSLKGAARAVELTTIESICQAVESVFAAWKRQEIAASAGLFDTLNEALDSLRAASAGGNNGIADGEERASLIKRLLTQAEPGTGGGATKAGAAAAKEPVKTAAKEPAKPTPAAKPPAESPAKPAAAAEAAAVPPDRRTPHAAEPPTDAERRERPAAALAAHATQAEAPRAFADVSAQADTIRVSMTKLTDLMLRMEELVSVKLMSRQRALELSEIVEALAMWKKKRHTMRAGLNEPTQGVWFLGETADVPGRDSRRRRSDKFIEYMDWDTAFVSDLAERVARLATIADGDHRTLAPLVDDLLDEVKSVVMLPFSSLSHSFPKMVRDLARAENKAVDLTVHGGDIEIDRHVIETIKDPVIHLLRNCVGHGIEAPDVRAKRGKPVRGSVKIAVSRLEGNKLEILIADDGAGVDPQRLRQVALKSGIRTKVEIEAMDDDQAMMLMFESGVSTNPIVTDVSGRGIGLAIVQEKAEQLGGTVTVAATPGAGTSFSLVVPATVATSRGVIVRVSDWTFVLPTVHVDRATRIGVDEVVSIESKETVIVDGETLPFVYLHDILGVPQRPRLDGVERIPVVVLGAGGDRIAFAVDWVIGEQEVLVKSLGPQLEYLPFISGATVLDSERVTPILYVPDLIRAVVQGSVRATSTVATRIEAAPKRRTILVAEDSITSRTLLKNILESAGFKVKTAVDGVEAMAVLKAEEIDLLISDVEMPRMNGFDLTLKVRADQKLDTLPVMLVTSLENKEDRERGVEVGANAYITKGSFDQTTLLETARRLM
jgi:two-component system chemotaxis sensor kinase CheA